MVLRVTVKAQYGVRAVCLVRGLSRRSFWHDFPDVEQARNEAISITPKVVCGLIRLALERGWEPEVSRSNFNLAVDRDVVRALAEDKS
jgi:hypothetical protein